MMGLFAIVSLYTDTKSMLGTYMFLVVVSWIIDCGNAWGILSQGLVSCLIWVSLVCYLQTSTWLGAWHIALKMHLLSESFNESIKYPNSQIATQLSPIDNNVHHLFLIIFERWLPVMLCLVVNSWGFGVWVFEMQCCHTW